MSQKFAKHNSGWPASESGESSTQMLEQIHKDYEHFAYIVSHDLQEPVRAVASYTHLLQDKYSEELSESAQRYLTHAAEGAQRLQDMVSGLLEYSRVSTRGQAFREADLNPLLETVLHRLSLEFDCKPVRRANKSLPTICCDDVQIRRVLYNVLHNALVFNQHHDDLQIELSCVAQHDGWCISICDNGPHIPHGMVRNIFAPFQHYHMASDFKSAGMGLAIAHRILQRHGGRIWLNQHPGIGKTFYLFLPFAPKPIAEFSTPS